MNRYSSLGKIGEGTYGVVYKALDQQTQQVVALKQIRLDNQDEGVPCTAIREIALLKGLRHPNIVKLLDVIHTNRKLILVFEFVDRGDLKKFMEEQTLDFKMIKSFLYQILSAVDFCHQNSILHRDLKPQNLLISKDGEVKLADFGLARPFGIPIKKLTHEVVTLWYRSPDVLLGNQHYGTAVDIWSIGCIFAEMALGQPLFAGKDEKEQLIRIYKVLGTPTQETWPNLKELPKYNILTSNPEFSMNYQRVPFSKTFEGKLDIACVDLLEKMLCYNPEKRITASEALKHPCLQSVRKIMS